MKTMVLGALAGVLILAFGLIAFSQSEGVNPQAPVVQRPFGVNDGLIALSEMVGQKYQQVTVIDPRSQTMCVYHIAFSNGEIALKSVRKIQWDLRMTDFNGTKPLAVEVKALSEQ